MFSLRCLVLLAPMLIAPPFAAAEWRGVDLSYVNELEDCGAIYLNGDTEADPFELLAEAGANIVRLRLWVKPDWTRYSTLEDVTRSMRRAKAAGLPVMLDFHYSDDWAHPGKQLRPQHWPPRDDVEALAEVLYQYTLSTLRTLDAQGLRPEVVAVGNEINTNLLVDEETAEDAPIDWPRNAILLRRGIEAVRAFGGADGPEVLLHIAQPENVTRFFDAAIEHGVSDFDHIGISYYPKWSSTGFDQLEKTVDGFIERYERPVSVVETAYPWTLEGVDEANNLLGEDSLVEGFPATEEGQAAYLEKLRGAVSRAGGNGVVYWEPAWVSSQCETRWGKGSHWENAALFDFEGRVLKGAGVLLRPGPAENSE